jgi:hypothetical protein
MSLKIILISIYLMISGKLLYGQVSQETNNEFNNYVRTLIDFSKFKDSTAIYTCQIQVIVDRDLTGGVVILSNDTSVFNKFIDIKAFKKFNFQKLMGNHHQVSFKVPIAIIISDSKYGKQNIDAWLLANRIAMLYSIPETMKSNLYSIQMFPLIVTVDKKVYN